MRQRRILPFTKAGVPAAVIGEVVVRVMGINPPFADIVWTSVLWVISCLLSYSLRLLPWLMATFVFFILRRDPDGGAQLSTVRRLIFTAACVPLWFATEALSSYIGITTPVFDAVASFVWLPTMLAIKYFPVVRCHSSLCWLLGAENADVKTESRKMCVVWLVASISGAVALSVVQRGFGYLTSVDELAALQWIRDTLIPSNFCANATVWLRS